MSDRFGFLFGFVILFLLGLFAAIDPKAAKKENEDVPGFYKTGFSWMPIWGIRFVGVATLGFSGIFLYMFLTH
jgi:hypothetical protein